MTQLLFALVMAIGILNMYIRAKASSHRIREVFEAENTIMAKDPVSFKDIKGSLEFENVYFKI